MSLDSYFSNLMSRTWLGDTSNPVKIEKSNIEALYAEYHINGYIVILGKTEKFYFILECHDSDGFKYSNGMFNHNFVKLINSYKIREQFLNGMPVEEFVRSIELQTKLETELSVKEKQVKRLKI